MGLASVVETAGLLQADEKIVATASTARNRRQFVCLLSGFGMGEKSFAVKTSRR
jgi:hypothetical protein